MSADDQYCFGTVNQRVRLAARAAAAVTRSSACYFAATDARGSTFDVASAQHRVGQPDKPLLLISTAFLSCASFCFYLEVSQKAA
eukprot:4293588-Pleurochrysis_carterae.AAC.2